MIARMVAAEAARAVEEAPDLFGDLLDKLRNPADWIGEFTIESVFAVVGVHTIHKVMHGATHGITRRLARIVRAFTGKGN